MKKVLYVTTVSRTINAFLVPHIEMLLKEGYEVQCACSIDKPVNKGLLEKGVKIYDIPFSRNPLGLGNIKAFKELVNIQKRENFDIVHVHTPIASIYGRLLKLRFKKLKTIYTAHGYHFLKGGSKLGWIMYYPIEKIMAKLTDTTININSEDYEITKNKLKPKNCYLLNGVGLDLNQYKKLSKEEIVNKKKELGLKESDFVILMIAELNENKNQIQLIKAMEVLKDKYPEIKAICVGEGDKLFYGIMYYPIEKIMAKLTDTTININSEDYEITKNKLKPKNCYLLNGVGLDLNQYKKLSKEEIVNKKKELGLKESDFVILMIAELNENKNQIQLIKAMEVLKDKYPEIKAICVGEGEKLLELQGEVKNRGLKDKVRFLGFRNDINELINICNIGVLLSYREGLPRNLMELMACGKKVIATNIRGCRDIVVDETVGELVEVGDYEATAKAIEEQYLYGDNEFTVSKEVEKYDVKTINDSLRLIYKQLEDKEVNYEGTTAGKYNSTSL